MQPSGRMKLQDTILKGDSKPCPKKIVQLNEEVIKGEIKELVRGSVEDTLHELLEVEAEKLAQAARISPVYSDGGRNHSIRFGIPKKSGI